MYSAYFIYIFTGPFSCIFVLKPFAIYSKITDSLHESSTGIRNNKRDYVDGAHLRTKRSIIYIFFYPLRRLNKGIESILRQSVLEASYVLISLYGLKYH